MPPSTRLRSRVWLVNLARTIALGAALTGCEIYDAELLRAEATPYCAPISVDAGESDAE